MITVLVLRMEIEQEEERLDEPIQATTLILVRILLLPVIMDGPCITTESMEANSSIELTHEAQGAVNCLSEDFAWRPHGIYQMKCPRIKNRNSL